MRKRPEGDTEGEAILIKLLQRKRLQNEDHEQAVNMASTSRIPALAVYAQGATLFF